MNETDVAVHKSLLIALHRKALDRMQETEVSAHETSETCRAPPRRSHKLAYDAFAHALPRCPFRRPRSCHAVEDGLWRTRLQNLLREIPQWPRA